MQPVKKRDSIEQNVPKYPVQLPVAPKQDVSPAETHQLGKKLQFDVKELQRLYYDVNGFNSLSIDEIHGLRSKAKHIFVDPKKFYYLTREELIEDYYKRFAKWFLLRKDLGLVDVDIMDPRNRVF